jgi:hypothetical protein
MSIRWKEFVFPALTVLWVAAYWSQLEGAPRAARVVPDGVMAFILALVVLIIVRDAVDWTGQKSQESATTTARLSPTFTISRIYQELAFVCLSIAYYVLFDYVGFHPANIAFLAIALRVTGNPWRTVLVGTITTGAIIFGVAEIMQFNMPTPKLFR